MKTPTIRVLATALGVAAALASDAPASGRRAAAQAGTETAGASRICFRGGPKPGCRSFWLVEMQYYSPLAQTTRMVYYGGGFPSPVQEFEDELEWNVGHMFNVTSSLAIGGVFTLGTGGGSGAFSGLKARVRRWLGPDMSLELEGGLLRTAARYPSANGVTSDARLNIRDQGSVFVRWDGLNVPRYAVDYGGGFGFIDDGGFQQALSAGIGLGSVPALVGTGALGLGYVILLGIFLAGDD